MNDIKNVIEVLMKQFPSPSNSWTISLGTPDLDPATFTVSREIKINDQTTKIDVTPTV
jgi:hypothetical protein